MNTTTFAHVREGSTVDVTRTDDSSTRVTFYDKGSQVSVFLKDGNCGPSLLIDLHALITRELIERGYRGEVDTNVHNAMARRFREGVRA